VRRLGDLGDVHRARVPPLRHHACDERLARDDAEELALVADDVDRAHLGRREHLSRLLRGRARRKCARLGDHRVADAEGLLLRHG